MSNQFSLEQFKQLVNSNRNTSASQLKNLEAIFDEIRMCFSSKDTGLRDHIKGLKEELVVRHIVYREPLGSYCHILNVLHDCIRPKGESGDLQSNWQSALSIISSNSTLLNNLRMDDEYVFATNVEAVAKGNVAVGLINLGYEVSIVGGGALKIAEMSIEKMHIDIDEKARVIGGRRLLDRMFKDIKSQYNLRVDRYMLMRDGRTLILDPKAQTP